MLLYIASDPKHGNQRMKEEIVRYLDSMAQTNTVCSNLSFYVTDIQQDGSVRFFSYYPDLTHIAIYHTPLRTGSCALS